MKSKNKPAHIHSASCYRINYASIYNWVILALSVFVFYIIFYAPYSSYQGYDQVITFYNYVTLISGGIFLVSLKNGSAEDAKNYHIYKCSGITMLLAILSIIFQRSATIPDLVTLPIAFISMLMFFYLLKTLMYGSCETTQD